MLALGGAGVLFRFVALAGITSLSLRTMSDTAQEAFARLQRFSTDWHANNFAGSTVRKVTRGMWALDLLTDSSDAYPRSRAYGHGTAEVRAGTNMHALREHAIVIDRGRRIDDASRAQLGIDVDYGAREDHHACLQARKLADRGARMHDGGDGEASGTGLLENGEPQSRIAERGEESIVPARQLRAVLQAADERPTACSLHARIAVIDEVDVRVQPGGMRGICSSAAVAAGARDQQLHSALPRNRSIVTWPLCEMPSARMTFERVAQRILRSSEKLW